MLNVKQFIYLAISSKFVFTKLCHGLHFVIVSVSRTVRVAMQVPVVMTTSLGQKISTVAVQQAPGTSGGQPTYQLANASPIGTATGNANSQPKVGNHASWCVS